MVKYRIGNGYDVHRLEDGLQLWLGGVRVEHSKGCVAHSDGDVVIHALCDALLGAAAMGDIGLHFPDTSDHFKGIDSKLLLAKTIDLITQNGFSVENVDMIIAMQKPKIRPYIDTMRQVLAEIMKIDVDDVSIKATTTEKLGFEGREEGVSAYAVTLLSRYVE